MKLWTQINARARYSISFGGSFPEIFLPQSKDNCLPAATLSKAISSVDSHPTQRNWSLYLSKAYHPLLVQQHRQKLAKAMKNVSDATAVSHVSTLVDLHVQSIQQMLFFITFYLLLGILVGRRDADFCLMIIFLTLSFGCTHWIYEIPLSSNELYVFLL